MDQGFLGRIPARGARDEGQNGRLGDASSTRVPIVMREPHLYNSEIPPFLRQCGLQASEHVWHFRVLQQGHVCTSAGLHS